MCNGISSGDVALIESARGVQSTMAKEKKLAPGDAAPDGQCLDKSGQERRLSEFWQEGPVLLTFLRHFG